MRVLFVISTPSAIAPLGVLVLAAICRREGHDVALAISRRGELLRRARSFDPDVIAYSATSADIDQLQRVDRPLRAWLRRRGRGALRIMGGPHPTYCPEVLGEMGLDAICQGDGDEALPELLRRLERGLPLEGIPNISVTPDDAPVKALVADLDALPFADHGLYFAAVPYARTSGLRSVHTGRGCPFRCTYCFNHVYSQKFGGLGPLLRRRSVDNVLGEIEHLVAHHPPVRMIRFSDDVFALRPDAWLREFVEQYPRRVGLPFYCLMRPNTLTEEVAALLARAGCRAIGMGIEAGSERVRRELLGREVDDRQVARAFAAARRLGIRIYAGAMVGIPGTDLHDDLETLELSRRLAPSAPLFTVAIPYKQTEMWNQAVARGYLQPGASPRSRVFADLPALGCFSPRQRRVQLRIATLGPLYVTLPAPLHRVVRALITSAVPLPRGLLRLFGLGYYSYRVATRIYRPVIPRRPGALLRAAIDNVRHL